MAADRKHRTAGDVVLVHALTVIGMVCFWAVAINVRAIYLSYQKVRFAYYLSPQPTIPEAIVLFTTEMNRLLYGGWDATVNIFLYRPIPCLVTLIGVWFVFFYINLVQDDVFRRRKATDFLERMSYQDWVRIMTLRGLRK